MTVEGGVDKASRRRWRSAGVATMVLALLASSCSSGAHHGAQSGNNRPGVSADTKAATQARAAPVGPRVTITPANDDVHADPSAGITVTAVDGTLTSVAVHTSGDAVSGVLGPGGTVWRSHWALDVSQTYTVTATAAKPGGATVTTTSTFRTLTPNRTFRTEILEASGQTYGVGMPIILYFSQPITNRAAVERALQVATSKPVVGAWYWEIRATWLLPAPTSGRAATGRPERS